MPGRRDRAEFFARRLTDDSSACIIFETAETSAPAGAAGGGSPAGSKEHTTMTAYMKLLRAL
ncbi:MAG: hypothetical protein KGI51_05495, partial [Rhodospirillales bacterium]|nr:hypothetical protein [Rhodospirillales bacterium]